MISNYYAQVAKYIYERLAEASCSFITIPNGLKQHPIPAAIIHSAPVKGLTGKLSDPSII